MKTSGVHGAPTPLREGSATMEMEVDPQFDFMDLKPCEIRTGFWATSLPNKLKVSCDVMWTSHSLEMCPESSLFTPLPLSPLKNCPFGVEDVIVMLPGNPGVVDWYEELASEIASRSCGRVAMVVMGYAGHHSHRKLTPGHWYDLQDQIDLANEFFRRVILPSFGNGSGGSQAIRVHVAGHSIGSFVAVHMASRFDCVEKCVLLTPTVCNMRASPNGSANTRLLQGPLIRAMATTAGLLTRFLPSGIQSSVVKYAQPRMEDSMLAIVCGMGSYHTVRNVLTMGRSEFEQIASIDEHLLGMVQDKVVAYFIRHDGWVPMSDVKLFQNACPRAKIIIENDCEVEHAWCLHHNDEVIKNAIKVAIPSVDTRTSKK